MTNKLKGYVPIRLSKDNWSRANKKRKSTPLKETVMQVQNCQKELRHLNNPYKKNVPSILKSRTLFLPTLILFTSHTRPFTNKKSRRFLKIFKKLKFCLIQQSENIILFINNIKNTGASFHKNTNVSSIVCLANSLNIVRNGWSSLSLIQQN